MSISIRSVFTVLAALSASSVAPAQVPEDAEPLIATDSGVMPVQAVIKTLDDEVILSTGDSADPLAPKDDSDTVEDGAMVQPVRPAGDLATLVAQFRGSDACKRELERLS